MHTTPIEWYDQFEDTKERKIYTFQEHGIPGLRMFGYQSTNRAIPALNMHYHKDSFEFVYMVQGNLRFAAGGHSYSISGGDLFVTQPGEVHDTGDIPMSLHQMYWFQVEVQDLTHFLYLEPTAARSLVERLRELPSHVIKASSSVEGILERVFENIAGGTWLGRMQAGQLLGVLLCQVLKDAEVPAFRITPDIGRATEYILEHLQDELDMEELAAVALLSVSRFKQKFKEQLGTSPRSFVNYHKIELAKKLLLEGRSVTDVAMELGFSSSNYFSAVFSRYAALPPTEYIKRAGERETRKESGEKG